MILDSFWICSLFLLASLSRAGLNRFEILLAFSQFQLECLGFDRAAMDLAPLAIFIRSVMYNEVYWSESSRSTMTMLHFLICELFRIHLEVGIVSFKKSLGEFVRSGDNDAREILANLITNAEYSLADAQIQPEDRDISILRDIHKRIYYTSFQGITEII